METIDKRMLRYWGTRRDDVLACARSRQLVTAAEKFAHGTQVDLLNHPDGRMQEMQLFFTTHPSTKYGLEFQSSVRQFWLQKPYGAGSLVYRYLVGIHAKITNEALFVQNHRQLVEAATIKPFYHIDLCGSRFARQRHFVEGQTYYDDEGPFEILYFGKRGLWTKISLRDAPSARKHTWLERNGLPVKKWPCGMTQSLAHFIAGFPTHRDHEQVDHINGDKLDNRIHNLRWLSVRDNAQNK